jgi:hypothetical protein
VLSHTHTSTTTSRSLKSHNNGGRPAGWGGDDGDESFVGCASNVQKKKNTPPTALVGSSLARNHHPIAPRASGAKPRMGTPWYSQGTERRLSDLEIFEGS